jgi:hypothetical protein
MRQNKHRVPSMVKKATSNHRCLLVAPDEMLSAAQASGLFHQVCDTIPTPNPGSGIFICGPGSGVQDLPFTWIGVWARHETPPTGAWIPLPVTAIQNSLAIGQALHTAEQWRQERLRQLTEREQNESAQKSVNEIGMA